MVTIKKIRKFMKAPQTMLSWSFANILVFGFFPVGQLFTNWWIVCSFVFVWVWYRCQYEPPKPPITIEQFTMDKPDKRYLVFGYCNHDSQGGMGDKIDSFHVLNDALLCVKKDSRNIHEIYDRIEGVEIDIDQYN